MRATEFVNGSAVKASGSSEGYRPDIDGLRAIAVTSVVLYHAGMPGLQSGFMGVDIFFVISGFLIGGIIYRGILTGNFSFAEFYGRRAKRILPALFAVVAFVCLAGLLILTPAELRRAAAQSIAALLGISNLLYWKQTDYFAPDSDLHPLLMTWSLGVEEQFYMLFPILLLLVARFRRRYHILALGLVCAVSLALSLIYSFRYPPHAFYLLPARAWEMAIGALLAMLLISRPNWSVNPLAKSDLLAVVGLSLMVPALFFFSKAWAFPGFIVILPVVGTALIIYTSGSRVNQLIGNRVMVYVGLISYSWYLWHWPLMALVRTVSDTKPTFPLMLIIAVGSFVLAALSQRYIEAPFRHAHFSTPAMALRRYAAALLIGLTIPGALFAADGWPSRLNGKISTIEAAADQIQDRPCLLRYSEEMLYDNSDCLPPNASVAIVGDSHAASLVFGLLSVKKPVAQLTKAACQPFDGYGPENEIESHFPELCKQYNDRALEWLKRNQQIDTVILAGAWPATTDQRFRKIVPGGDPC